MCITFLSIYRILFQYEIIFIRRDYEGIEYQGASGVTKRIGKMKANANAETH